MVRRPLQAHDVAGSIVALGRRLDGPRIRQHELGRGARCALGMLHEFRCGVENAGDEVVLVLRHPGRGEDAVTGGRKGAREVVALERGRGRTDEVDELRAVVLRVREERDDLCTDERKDSQHAGGRGRSGGSDHADAPGPRSAVVVATPRINRRQGLEQS